MDFKNVANQLACPAGPFGVEVGLGMNKLNEFISKTTYDLLDIGNADIVLEIGLGNGKFIKDILDFGDRVSYTGIDISRTMIEEAKKENHELLKTGFVDLILGDIEKMPFWNETFNKICTVNTIYFWQNPIVSLNEVYRVLTKGGIFIIALRPYIEEKSLDFSEYGFTEFRKEDMQILINKTKFKILAIKNETEPQVEFNGQIHDLISEYYILQK